MVTEREEEEAKVKEADEEDGETEAWKDESQRHSATTRWRGSGGSVGSGDGGGSRRQGRRLALLFGD
ncbi:hypothetical protein PINS_up011392 [Pythium insidiosum]|nr:hypothetical protein PINS_up011392 [Pythium insidiosum]